MRSKLLSLAAALAVLAPSARAAERVTLRNGFELRCDHRAQIEGRVRLYLSAGEDNYIEFPSQDLATVEQVPDSSPPTASAQNSPPASTGGSLGAKLNQADLSEMLAKAGHEHNLDVDLLASVVKAESGGNARAISRTGARGLMQLMPGTATGLSVEDSFQPEQNVRGGSTYLDSLLVRYRDNLALALAAYNAGPAAVDKCHGIPPYHETQAYVARVIHEFNRRALAREAGANRTVSQARTSRN
jgi:soluble lytic murein transglycosylase-like protein